MNYSFKHLTQLQYFRVCTIWPPHLKVQLQSRPLNDLADACVDCFSYISMPYSPMSTTYKELTLQYTHHRDWWVRKGSDALLASISRCSWIAEWLKRFKKRPEGSVLGRPCLIYPNGHAGDVEKGEIVGGKSHLPLNTSWKTLCDGQFLHLPYTFPLGASDVKKDRKGECHMLFYSLTSCTVWQCWL